MGFIESYKHLEKLCGDMLQTQHGISAYIDDMENTPKGSYLVQGWDEDFKRLKHYRWIRNQIAHEPNCTEENMCEYGDAQWIDDFYDRIMNQSDPLAMYRNSTINLHSRNIHILYSRFPQKRRCGKPLDGLCY